MHAQDGDVLTSTCEQHETSAPNGEAANIDNSDANKNVVLDVTPKRVPRAGPTKGMLSAMATRRKQSCVSQTHMDTSSVSFKLNVDKQSYFSLQDGELIQNDVGVLTNTVNAQSQVIGKLKSEVYELKKQLESTRYEGELRVERLLNNTMQEQKIFKQEMDTFLAQPQVKAKMMVSELQHKRIAQENELELVKQLHNEMV